MTIEILDPVTTVSFRNGLSGFLLFVMLQTVVTRGGFRYDSFLLAGEAGNPDHLS